MTNKYYIPKSLLKGLKSKQSALKYETTRLFFQFFIKGNNTYVQQNFNMYLESKT